MIEFGAGFSTLIFKYFLEKNGNPYDLISIEQNGDWFKIPESLKTLYVDKEISLHFAPVNFHFGYLGIYARYDIGNDIEIPSDLDIQLVDGPQYYFGREGALDFTFNKLKTDALIIMDDAERYTEQCVIYKWLKVYQGLELIYLNENFGQKGLAILRVNSPLVRTFSISTFIIGFYQGLKRLWNLNFGKGKAGSL